MTTMKLIAILSALMLTMSAKADNTTIPSEQAKAKQLEVTFNYQRQAGPGSNQYAVWIENEAGEVVKTLFVTSFTTKGRARGGQQAARGYTYRPTCVPTWVKQVKAEERKDVELDAYTGATPQESGRQSFVWDFKDQQGNIVKNGTYKVRVEATLINDCVIIYEGDFSTSDKAGKQVTLISQLTKPNETHKKMITEVAAVLK